MKLRNLDVNKFTAMFGEEALGLIEGVDAHMWIVSSYEALMMGMGDMPAVACRMIPGGETESVIAVLFNMAALAKQLADLGITGDEDIQLELRSRLVHELVHVKQMQEGRLITIDGIDMWEGKPANRTTAVTEEYFDAPWEIEAYVEQYMYAFGYSKEEALEHYKNIKAFMLNAA